MALVAGGALLLAVAFRIWVALQIPTPWILVDEIVYSEFAKSFAEGGVFLVRERSPAIPSVLYPILIAPAWLADPVSTAYGAAKTINVLLMTATVVPTYLWARRLVSPAWALVAAVLVLLMPSFLYTGVLMSENAFFPLFVAAGYATAAALERPTAGRQALAVAAALVGVTIRVQGLVLLAILPAAIALKLLLDLRASSDEPRSRRAWLGLRPFWPTFAALAVGAFAYTAYKVSRGQSLASALGSYQTVTDANYSLGDGLHWVVLHFAELGFSVGVVPACALLLLLGLAVSDPRTTTPAERAFLAVATASVALVVVQVALFASRFSLRIEERYMFPLAPLCFVALVVWLARGLPRPPLLAVPAALIPVLLLLKVDLEGLLGIQILSDTFGLIPIWRAVQLLDGGAGTAQLLLWLGAGVAAAAFLLLPRRLAPLLPLGVAAFLALSSYPVYGAVRDYSRSLEAYAGATNLDWLDDRVASGAEVPFLYDAARDPAFDAMIVWQSEFWNRSFGSVIRLGPATRDPLPEQAASADPATGRISGVEATRWAVAARGLELAGTPVERRPLMTLYRVRGPLRLAGAVEGVYADGWMGTHAAWTRYAGRAERVRVVLSREAWGGPDVPGRATVRVGTLGLVAGVPQIVRQTASRTVVLHTRRRQVLTLSAPRPPFRVDVDIEPTFSPSEFGAEDTRQLGAQVTFSYRD
ncbi:MAG: hypothetical protein ABR583_06745 [Gaiellaceae bacterium]